MALKMARFINLLLATLVMGITSCQVVANVQGLLLHDIAALRTEALFFHDWDIVTAGIEMGALLSAAAAAYWVRHHHWSFLLTLIGVMCLADMVFLQMFFLILSTEQVILGGIRAALAGIGYSALLLAVIIDTSNPTRQKATVTYLTVVKSSRDSLLQPRRGSGHGKRIVKSLEHRPSQ